MLFKPSKPTQNSQPSSTGRADILLKFQQLIAEETNRMHANLAEEVSKMHTRLADTVLPQLVTTMKSDYDKSIAQLR